MNRRPFRLSPTILVLLLALAGLAACQQGSPTTGPTPGASATVVSPTSLASATTPSAPPTTPTTATPAVTIAVATQAAASTPTVGPTDTATAPPASSTTTESATKTPVPATTATPTDDISANVYLDDRSGPVALIRSYYNAINRKEYVRAYSYWASGAASSHLAPFPRFQQGYASTASVQLSLGAIGSDVGAGQIYYSVPVSLAATTADGTAQQFVGCYSLHMANPGIPMVPPYRSLAIEDATIQTVADGESPVDLLAHACDAKTGGQSMPARPSPTFSPTDIGKARYLDDRSDPVQVLRSYYNAINRHEYARAYSYWETGAAASPLPPFAQFQQGYAKTATVSLTTGQVTSDAGAGQLNYSVPIALNAETTDGASQTFVGCYQLHLAQPGVQAVPPFQPLGIRAASVQEVPNDADTATLMGQACH